MSPREPLDGHPPARCALFAREIAELALGRVGLMEEDVDRTRIYSLIEDYGELAP